MPQEQHFRLTFPDAIAKYNSGDITAKGLVHFYILIKCAPGWRIKLDWRELKDILPISKAAFYNAISRLKADGEINWEAPEGILVSISSPVCECGLESTNVESQSTNVDLESTNVDCQPTIVDSKTSKPALQEEFSDRPDSYHLSNKFNSLPPTPLKEGECGVLEKFEEKLKRIGVYMQIYSGDRLIANPRMKPILQELSKVPPPEIERLIFTFLTWAQTTTGIKDIYKAFRSAVSKRWAER